MFDLQPPRHTSTLPEPRPTAEPLGFALPFRGFPGVTNTLLLLPPPFSVEF